MSELPQVRHDKYPYRYSKQVQRKHAPLPWGLWIIGPFNIGSDANSGGHNECRHRSHHEYDHHTRVATGASVVNYATNEGGRPVPEGPPRPLLAIPVVEGIRPARRQHDPTKQTRRSVHASEHGSSRVCTVRQWHVTNLALQVEGVQSRANILEPATVQQHAVL